jgi:glycosyltransferase involved in cell wall biosynthesis
MNNNQSICFVQRHYYKFVIGGAEVQAYLLASQFFKSGWKVHYLTMDVDEDTEDEGIILHPFSQRNDKNKYGYQDIHAALKRINADVYYQRGRGESTSYLSLFCKEENKPFITSLSMDIDCRKYKNLPRAFEKGFRPTPKVLYRLVRDYKLDRKSLSGLHLANIVLCQSQYQLDQLGSNLGIQGMIFKNVHPVPDETTIIKTDPPTVLWLANMKEWKQPEIFVSLAENLQKLNCRFVLGGRIAWPGYRRFIKDAQERLDNFSHIEDVSLERSNELISQASLFVNTSLCNEGFPNTFVQAWLRKTPTVTLNFDPDGIIEKESLGRHSKTFDGLVDDVANLINDNTEREAIGVRARVYAENEFGLTKNFPLLRDMASDLAGDEGVDE